jgi:hypothetical protein
MSLLSRRKSPSGCQESVFVSMTCQQRRNIQERHDVSVNHLARQIPRPEIIHDGVISQQAW